MLRLIERNIAAIEERLVVLAPPGVSSRRMFGRVSVDLKQHRELVSELQAVRGNIYLDDGAVQRHQLSPDGRHETPEDERSWHLLMLNREGRVNSCIGYLEHRNPTSIQQLRVKSCPLNGKHPLRDWFLTAITREMALSRELGLGYGEVGGWAVSQESRCTSEGLLLALGAFSLARRLGDAICLTTATVRHSSSTILRRLGGSHLEVDGAVVPSYFDEHYGCEMELLRFDSRRPSAKYSAFVEGLKERFANVAVIARPAEAIPAFAQHKRASVAA